jgi:short-subunit dehydrogenase
MTGRTAVVTGASSGIGAALAVRLAARSDHLHLIGRDPDRLQSVVARCAAGKAAVGTHALDVCDRAAQQALLAGIDARTPINLFVANAGILDGRHANEATETADAARRVLETNLLAAIDGLHAVLPGMLARRSGTLVLIASLGGLTPLADAPAYSASKAGLIAFGLAMGEAVRASGVRVCVVCPGYVTTPMSDRHEGKRPLSVTADEAALRILAAADAGRPLSGFPLPLYWLARLSALAPSSLRRLASAGLRFHIGPDQNTT